MMEELRRHGYDVGAACCPPRCTKGSRVWYLTSRPRSLPARRKYYRATAAGSGALEEAKTKLRAELVSKVLHDRPPTRSIRSDKVAAIRRKRKSWNDAGA